MYMLTYIKKKKEEDIHSGQKIFLREDLCQRKRKETFQHVTTK